MLTDALASSQFAISGKLTGQHAIVLTGRAPTPSALLIDGPTPRGLSAGDTWGLPAAQVEETLKRRLGRGWRIAAIGPAGEPGLRSHAGRGGLGAVLGAKNIKAARSGPRRRSTRRTWTGCAGCTCSGRTRSCPTQTSTRCARRCPRWSSWWRRRSSSVLFAERFNTDEGLAHPVPAQWLPAKELSGADYPLVINTGRLLQHWHTGSMPRHSYALDAIAPRAEVYEHPKDAADRWLAHGEMVRVHSRRGEIELRLTVSHREALGNCFIPFHFREASANLLTIDEIDSYGKIFEFKFCAARIESLR